MIPVSVIMMTKDEADAIPRTLPSLITHFDDVHVLDSNSADGTAQIAEKLGARVTQFEWNGRYPKKKQWGIDNLPLKHEWILQIDADEDITDEFIGELQNLDWKKDGYFVPAKMIWNGKPLHHGMMNNKLCLYKKSLFNYPVINDLDSIGGWEVEGHYQPLPLTKSVTIGRIRSPLWHRDNTTDWVTRHRRYARWEADMNRLNAWTKDPVPHRERLKKIIRGSWLRPFIIFFYAYIWKNGFMDGFGGLHYARHRALYTYWIRQMREEENKSSYSQ